MNERNAALNAILRRWRDTHSIRFAGKCPHCKASTLWSFQLHDDKPRNDTEETCGYYCVNCRWGNAGSRPIESEETDE